MDGLRAAGHPRRCPALGATEAARARLYWWATTLGRPTLSRRVVDRDLVVLGLTPLVRRDLVAALRRMPPPVVHHVVVHVWIIGISYGVGGWTWGAPPVPPSQYQLIVLDATRGPVWSLFAHEVAHAWLIPAAEQPSTIRERTRVRVLRHRLATEWNLLHVLVREVRRDERQAARLARAWGFDGDAADPDVCENQAVARGWW